MTDVFISDKLKEAVKIAQAIAREYSHLEYSSAHLLKALLHKSIGMLKYIESIGQDAYYIEEWAEVRLEALPRTTKVPENPASDSSIEAIFYEAESAKLKIGVEDINEFCVLIALCTPGVGFSFEQLKTMPLTPAEIINNLTANGHKPTEIEDIVSNNSTANKNAASNSILETYCIDKTAAAKSETLEKISGRDSEIKMITEILGRRSKPNVLVLGDPGVGKTVLLNGLAYATLSESIPEHLKNARVFELDFIPVSYTHLTLPTTPYV